MKFATALILTASLFLTSIGCGGSPTTTNPKPAAAHESDPEISAALAQLDPEDRRLAEAQKFCAVDEENPLGKMGKPFKVMLNDRPVFLCCKGCKKSAERDPEKTLAKVEALKARAAQSPEK